MQYLHFSMYVHMYQITCSVVARLSNHHHGLPQGLFSVCSYLLEPTGNHGQTQESVLGVVFFKLLSHFTISIQGFIACSILATENEHLASLTSWKYKNATLVGETQWLRFFRHVVNSKLLPMIAKIVYQRVGRLCRDGMYTNESVSICYYISVTFLPCTLLCTSLLCPLVNSLCLYSRSKW